MEVGDIDAKANKIKVDIEDSLSAKLAATLVSSVPQEKQKWVDWMAWDDAKLRLVCI